ncbi:MAG: adenine deaminase [Clostridia bacterium]|nr:adenine deaminase [Clostridia bacterium]
MSDIIKRRIDIAAGRKKAELVLKHAKIVNVFTEEIIDADIAIDQGFVVAIGSYDGEVELDMAGKYVAPGLIDSHVHIESAMVTPSQFAKSILPAGTTTIIADPHEIANVCGLEGIQYILDESSNIPLDVYLMLPSCVPSTNFENAGAVIHAKDMTAMMAKDRILGLGELMDFPGVINADSAILDKIHAAGEKIIDGHGPVIANKQLNAYVAAGIRTEHECSTKEEMIDRLRLGMYVLIREGSAARNLESLIKGVTKENVRRILFCTDDRHPGDILKDGHIDNNVRLAIKNGVAPITAIKIATLNAAECYRLHNKGAVAPGYHADLIVFDDLNTFKIEKVFKKGNLIAENGQPLFKAKHIPNGSVTDTVNLKPVTQNDLRIKLNSDIVNVIHLLPHSLITEKVVRKVEVHEGEFVHNKRLDILKLAVIERHNATGNIGLGLVENFQLKSGALASTVAHDSHNLIVIGTNDADMIEAVKEIERIGGGLAIVDKGQVIHSIPLPIAGLMTDQPIEALNKELIVLYENARKLGVNKTIDPFMTLAFLALPVIPEIKLTDLGLFDVTSFRFININNDDE